MEQPYQMTAVVGIHHAGDLWKLVPSSFRDSGHRSCEALAFEIRRQTIKNVHVLLYLISRRSRYRAGTRYFRRGVDEDGNVANFNETEQMVFVDKVDSEEQKFPHLLSYVQTRGSIPLYWAEISTLRYKPDLQIMEGEERVCWFVLVVRFCFLRSPR